MRAVAIGILSVVMLCLCAMLATLALGAPADMGAIERAAADPSTIVQSCTCVEGPLASEIEKLRTQIRLLKAAALVNKGIQCAAARKATK
jgi:hypothetical protein